MTIKKALADARRRLETEHDYGLVAFMLRDYDETRHAGLWNLSYDLGTDRYCTSKNDVLFLIEELEKWVKDHESTK